MEEISISKADQLLSVKIDGTFIDGVKDYKITSLASGKTRLVLVFEFSAEVVSTTLKV